MPVAVVQDWVAGGDDTSNYDALHERITASGPIEGFLVHTAGATPDGGFRIFEVWQSEEAFQRFVQERLMPLLQELGGGDAEPPKLTTYELRQFVTA